MNTPGLTLTKYSIDFFLQVQDRQLKSTKAPTIKSTKAPTIKSTKAPSLKSSRSRRDLSFADAMGRDD
jgi:hypothetical protein